MIGSNLLWLVTNDYYCKQTKNLLEVKVEVKIVNGKFLSIIVILSIILLATPLVSAVPGAEKSNVKFDFLQLVVSGTGSGEFDKYWMTPPTALSAEESKTVHGREGGWITGDIVELTIGSVTYTKNTSPVRVDYTTTYDVNTIRNQDGSVKHANINLHDVVTIYLNDEPIGTIELLIKAQGGPDIGYSGVIVGYGTEALEGVHITAIDTVLPPTFAYTRIGTIQGWPGLPAPV